MGSVQDLSNIGQKKEGKMLDLKFPSPEETPLTSKQFVEFSLYNFEQVGLVLKMMLEFMNGQHKTNEVFNKRLKTLEDLIDAWISAAKKQEKIAKKKIVKKQVKKKV